MANREYATSNFMTFVHICIKKLKQKSNQSSQLHTLLDKKNLSTK